MRKLCLLLISIVITSGLFTGCSNEKIDLMSFATVSFSGLDGSGRASLDIEWIDFEHLVLSQDETSMYSAIAKVSELMDSINYTIDSDENLSNGDKVKVSVEWNKDIAKKYDLAFTGKDMEVKVSGLKTPTEIDIFEDVHIDFEGVAPFAKAIVRNSSSDEFIKKVDYTIENSKELSNGDKITIKADYNQSTAEEYGYLIAETTKVYTVDGVDEYITSYDVIDEDTLNAMDKQARDTIDATLADRYSYVSHIYPDRVMMGTTEHLNSVSINSIELKNSYFFTLKKGITSGYDNINNSMFMVYEIKFTTRDTPKDIDYETVFLPVYYKNIILRDDGKIDIVVTDATIASAKSNDFDNLYRDIVTANKAKYEYESITHNSILPEENDEMN